MAVAAGDVQAGKAAQLNGILAKNGVQAITGANLENFTVVKRNGQLVPFRRSRIFRAIELALRATHAIAPSAPLPQNLYSVAQQVTDDVVEAVAVEAAKGACVTVEGIQDTVEVKLMKAELYEVARNYIIYRDEHKSARDDSPRSLKITRRDGTSTVRFNPMKIASAIERAFRASMKIEGPTPQDVIDSVNLLTNKVVARAAQLSREGTELHVELIQDEVERQMMSEGYYQVAKDFILYRAQRAAQRLLEGEHTAPIKVETREVVAPVAPGQSFKATAVDGTTVAVTEGHLRARIQHACRGLENLVSSEAILQESIKNFYEGIKIDEIDQANIMAARSKIEKDPAYSLVAARLLLDIIYRETIKVDAHSQDLEKAHQEYFKACLKKGVSVERMAPELLDFDLDRLAKAIKLERDLQFQYLGLQTLYDRYLIHHEDVRLETPQIFWMRVAMGLSVNEGAKKNERAIEFYDVLSKFLFTSSTPTLFNAGTLHPQLSSCYLTTVMDDLQHIFKCVADDAQLSK